MTKGRDFSSQRIEGSVSGSAQGWNVEGKRKRKRNRATAITVSGRHALREGYQAYEAAQGTRGGVCNKGFTYIYIPP